MREALLLDPTKKFPMVMPDGTVIRTVVYLNQVIDHPRMEIGDFTYFGHFEELDDYAGFIAPFLFSAQPGAADDREVLSDRARCAFYHQLCESQHERLFNVSVQKFHDA